MLNTIEAVVQNGKIIPLEKVEVPNGTKALITLLPEEENDFWLSASEDSANEIWNNEEDDVYAELLEK
ncbi:MAG: antitoxin family protein [Acidobacteria bacterium]|nr:antitoxin family protein [Acidobacteriota bacterium]